MTSELGRRALVVLHQADKALEGSSCPGTSECCHFAVTGRQPYLTEAEWQVVMDELMRQERTIPPPREDGACAFLLEGRCSIYAARPLGCRTYYCHRGGPRIPRRAWSDLKRHLEVISSDPDHHGLPITTLINRARRVRA